LVFVFEVFEVFAPSFLQEQKIKTSMMKEYFVCI